MPLPFRFCSVAEVQLGWFWRVTLTQCLECTFPSWDKKTKNPQKKRGILRKELDMSNNWECGYPVCLFFAWLFPMVFFPLVTTSGLQDEEGKHYKSWACTIIGPVSMPNKEMEELRLGSRRNRLESLRNKWKITISTVTINITIN